MTDVATYNNFYILREDTLNIHFQVNILKAMDGAKSGFERQKKSLKLRTYWHTFLVITYLDNTMWSNGRICKTSKDLQSVRLLQERIPCTAGACQSPLQTDCENNDLGRVKLTLFLLINTGSNDSVNHFDTKPT